MITMATIDGRRVKREQILEEARAGDGQVLVRDLLDHLELMTRDCENADHFRDADALAARGALNLIAVLSERFEGWSDELAVRVR